MSVGDFIEDKSAENPSDVTSYSLLLEKLSDVLTTLTERERKILEMRFGLADGYERTLEEIGKMYNVTRERIRQIEAKVVTRLRQVTSAIKQDGTNQVNVIASTAEQQAAAEFARAAAIRPQIVGDALFQVSQDPEISEALFDVLETQNIIEGEAVITIVPEQSGVLSDLLAASQMAKSQPAK